jgi:uncharacterized circularly permuted ATP-grasp superfamily protein
VKNELGNMMVMDDPAERSAIVEKKNSTFDCVVRPENRSLDATSNLEPKIWPVFMASILPTAVDLRLFVLSTNKKLTVVAAPVLTQPASTIN